ncbi:MAG TPA: dipicolinate synthase subunit DpsA [Ruminococcaceae bacterium]|nr:dipicolinate synthase subunit DpsA [Oscillospiraceae bacterium]
MKAIGNIKTFAVIGGDKRQLFLADSLVRDGFRVIMGGFDSLLSIGAITLADVPTAINYADAVIMPLPCIRGDGSLNTPFSSDKLYFTDDLIRTLINKPVFAGMADKLLRAYPELKAGNVYDYARRDDFAVLNAVPTAEGAVLRAMSEYEGTIAGSRTMVAGFGRIGKILSGLLKSLGSRVTVCARSSTDKAYIEALGYKFKNTSRLDGVQNIDIVFNTIPSLIFTENVLKNTCPDTLFIDLASLPGGIDFEAANALGIDAHRALSLPGKYSPKAAGEIIKNTVYTILS